MRGAAGAVHIRAMTSQTALAFLSLGEITDALAALPAALPAFVMMDGDLFTPDGVDSYRGNAADLAIEPVHPGCHSTVADVLGCLIAADGKIFDGFGGGEYLMHRDTSVCVSTYKAPSGAYVTGVEVRDGAVAILTANAG